MPDADFVVFQGDTASVLERTLLDDDGAPVDIELADVQFVLVPMDGGDPTIDAEAFNDQVGDGSDGSKGKVSYPWQTGDTDESGWYDARFVVTFGSGGEIQTYPNVGAIRVFVVPSATRSADYEYVTVASIKQTMQIYSGAVYADDDLAKTVVSCSRAIDNLCHRRFYVPESSNPEQRRYTAKSPRVLHHDDVAAIETIEIDRDGDGTYEEEWTEGVEYVFEPLNAPLDAAPYERLRVRARSSRRLPQGVEAGVRITGQFGWLETPAPIVDATTILARRILERKRMAPLGVVAVGVDAATRIARSDPDVLALVEDYVRDRILVS